MFYELYTKRMSAEAAQEIAKATYEKVKNEYELGKGHLSNEDDKNLREWIYGGIREGAEIIKIITDFLPAGKAAKVLKTIKEMNMEDLSFKLKIEAQKEFLGYISLVSGKAEDRPKLHVKEVYQARRKKDNKSFGINILCQSIGSGKQNRYTIFNKTLNKNGQVKVGDIIHCTQWSSSNGYFTIDDYFHII